MRGNCDGTGAVVAARGLSSAAGGARGEPGRCNGHSGAPRAPGPWKRPGISPENETGRIGFMTDPAVHSVRRSAGSFPRACRPRRFAVTAFVFVVCECPFKDSNLEPAD